MAPKIAAGNWKMNGTRAALAELDALAPVAASAPGVELVICPPATLIAAAAGRAQGVGIGGQDCHSAASGAHTGDLSAAMLADAGARSVILGHSERRQDHGERDALIAAKLSAAQAAGLRAILCLGESLAQREAGETLAVIGAQLAGSLPEDADPARLIVAYEPIWAIGTGLTPSLAQIGEVHGFLRGALARRFGAAAAGAIPLLYGGSVKPANAAEIFGVADVDGALVGGASLKASDFGPIVAALNAA